MTNREEWPSSCTNHSKIFSNFLLSSVAAEEKIKIHENKRRNQNKMISKGEIKLHGYYMSYCFRPDFSKREEIFVAFLVQLFMENKTRNHKLSL
jgi:hypothetical protein